MIELERVEVPQGSVTRNQLINGLTVAIDTMCQGHWESELHGGLLSD